MGWLGRGEMGVGLGRLIVRCMVAMEPSVVFGLCWYQIGQV